MRNTFVKAGIVGLALSLSAGGAAFADQMKYSADLTGGAEVPPVETDATGSLDATYDTDSRELSWQVTYSGLSGDPQAAHFHGPAAKGENAPPMVPVEISNLDKGSATLTQDQADALTNGMMYFNIHTAEHQSGEIRGQVTQAQ